jgi:hypothetical protein
VSNHCWFRWTRKASGKHPFQAGWWLLSGDRLTSGGLDLHIVDRLHEARSGHEECGITDSAGRGYNLATTPVQRLWCHHSIQNLELDVPDGLVAERAFPGPPLEALEGERTLIGITPTESKKNVMAPPQAINIVQLQPTTQARRFDVPHQNLEDNAPHYHPCQLSLMHDTTSQVTWYSSTYLDVCDHIASVRR